MFAKIQSSMILLLLLGLLTLIAGNIRSVHFKKSLQLNTACGDNHWTIQCAFSCLTRENFIAFRITFSGSECAPLSKPCGSSVDGTICYQKVNHKPRCQKSNCSMVRDSDGQHDPNGREHIENSGHTQRLLLMPYDTMQLALELDLRTGVIQQCPIFALKRVKSAIFLFISRKLLFCSGHHPEIASMRLDGTDKTTLRDATAVDMAVDEGEDILFFIKNIAFRGSVYKMSTKGEKYKRIFKLTTAYHLVSDLKRKRLYISTARHIMSCSYTGSSLEYLEEGQSMYALAFNPKADLIYYSHIKDPEHRYEIVSRNLTSEEKKSIQTLNSLVKDIVYVEERIYVGTYTGVFTIQHIQGNASISKLGFKATGRMILSLVP